MIIINVCIMQGAGINLPENPVTAVFRHKEEDSADSQTELISYSA